VLIMSSDLNALEHTILSTCNTITAGIPKWVAAVFARYLGQVDKLMMTFQVSLM